MPFTFSHLVVVIPFRKGNGTFLSISGLAAGSVAPDFEYLLRMKKGASLFSHTVPSLVYFNLPVALGLCFLFHVFLKPRLALRLPLPEWKGASPEAFDWPFYFRQRWYVVAGSILLGGASHLVWDRWVHNQVDFLYHHQHELFSFDSWIDHIRIYAVVHGLHSLAGLTLLLLFLRWRRPEPQSAVPMWKSHGVIVATSFFIFALRVGLGPRLRLEDLLVSAMSSVFLGIVLLAVCTLPTPKRVVKD